MSNLTHLVSLARKQLKRDVAAALGLETVKNDNGIYSQVGDDVILTELVGFPPHRVTF